MPNPVLKMQSTIAARAWLCPWVVVLATVAWFPVQRCATTQEPKAQTTAAVLEANAIGHTNAAKPPAGLGNPPSCTLDSPPGLLPLLKGNASG
jgi:hypothetical protein